MSDMNRREALGLIGLASLAVACDRAGREAQRVRAGGRAHQPQFFSAHEWATVQVLVDLILPKDERSGSATDAAVPEFMDFMMTDRPDAQTWMRGGLAWMDAECRDRWGKPFIECTEAERTALLDDIAWPKKAPPALSQGVAFFNRFRDLTASGFWSSRMGVEDLQYKGNMILREWNGCPEPALRKLGVSYETT